jgi:hypothetical protein
MADIRWLTVGARSGVSPAEDYSLVESPGVGVEVKSDAAARREESTRSREAHFLDYTSEAA